MKFKYHVARIVFELIVKICNFLLATKYLCIFYETTISEDGLFASSQNY